MPVSSNNTNTTLSIHLPDLGVNATKAIITTNNTSQSHHHHNRQSPKPATISNKNKNLYKNDDYFYVITNTSTNNNNLFDTDTVAIQASTTPGAFNENDTISNIDDKSFKVNGNNFFI